MDKNINKLRKDYIGKKYISSSVGIKEIVDIVLKKDEIYVIFKIFNNSFNGESLWDCKFKNFFNYTKELTK